MPAKRERTTTTLSRYGGADRRRRASTFVRATNWLATVLAVLALAIPARAWPPVEVRAPALHEALRYDTADHVKAAGAMLDALHESRTVHVDPPALVHNLVARGWSVGVARHAHPGHARPVRLVREAPFLTTGGAEGLERFVTGPRAEAHLVDLLGRIQRRNDVAGRAAWLDVADTLDGPDQFVHHLQTTHGVPSQFALEAASGFDHRALVKSVRTTRPIKLLRLYGGGAQKSGRWLFCCIDLPDASRTALPIANDTSRMAVVDIPAGTTMLIGVVRNQRDRSVFRSGGGNTQFYLPVLALPDAAYHEYIRATPATSAYPRDLVVHTDEGKVRFRPAQPTAL